MLKFRDPLNKWDDGQCTVGQTQVVLRHRIIHLPTSLGMSKWASKQMSAAERLSKASSTEQANKFAVQVSKRMGKRVALFLRPDSWLFWTTVQCKLSLALSFSLSQLWCFYGAVSGEFNLILFFSYSCNFFPLFLLLFSSSIPPLRLSFTTCCLFIFFLFSILTYSYVFFLPSQSLIRWFVLFFVCVPLFDRSLLYSVSF